MQKTWLSKISMILLAIIQVAPAFALDLPDYEIQTNANGEVIGVVNRTVARTGRKSTNTDSHPETRKISASIEADSLSVSNSDSFIDSKKELFKISNVSLDLFPKSSYEDQLGFKHVRYEQRYNGVKVYGSELISHLNKDFEVISTNGRFLDGINVDTKAELHAVRAYKIAKKDIETAYGVKKLKALAKRQARKDCRELSAKKSIDITLCVNKGVNRTLKANEFSLSKDSQELIIYNDRYINNRDGGVNKLAWKLTVQGMNGEVGYDYIIDANTKEILKKESKEQHLTRKIFDCADPKGDVACYLDLEWFYPGGILYGHGRSEGKPIRGPIPAVAEVPAAYHGSTEVDQLYDKAPQLYQFYLDKFGRQGPNGLGGTGNGNAFPVTEVRFVAHADLGGTGCPGAVAWVAPNNAIRVCKGNVLDDVLAHESAHIVAQSLGNPSQSGGELGKTGETGALNEHNADILGDSFEKYISGNNDWLSAANSTTGISRNMVNPEALLYSSISDGIPATPYPDKFHSVNFYCGTWNSGGIHVNSTVPSKAAYLASEGGSFNGCTIQGIGLEKVEQIWYRALTAHFTANETFNMAYNSLNAACQDLAANPEAFANFEPPFTITQSDCDQVKAALQAVELDQAGACSGQPAEIPECALPVPLVGDFNNDEIVDLWDYNVFKTEFFGITPSLNSDANNDGTITEADYTIWLNAYNQPNSPPLPTKSGDCDNDGIVDGSDFLKWQRLFGQTGPALTCDFNADGIIDSIDLNLWKSGFGN